MTLYYLNQYISKTLATTGGITSSQTTGILLSDVSGIDTTKPGIACLSYSDPIDTSKAEWITYTSINSVTYELNGVTRGQEGYSAKAHSNGVTVGFPISESHINNINDLLTGNATGVVLDEPDLGQVVKRSAKIYDNGNSGASATIDWSNGETQKITLTDNCTLSFSNVVAGGYLTLWLIQDATGSRTVTWPSGTKHPGGTAPTLTTTANAIDIVGIRAYDASTYHVIANSLDIK